MRFTYEQCRSRGASIYKFAERPVVDGAWHRLNSDSRAVYRIAGDALQFVDPCELSDDDLAWVLERIRAHGPIATDDDLEITIEKTGNSWTLPSVFCPPGESAPCAGLDALGDAYERLKALEASAG